MVKNHNALKRILNLVLVALIWVVGAISVLNPQMIYSDSARRHTVKLPNYNNTGYAVNTINGLQTPPPSTPPPPMQAKGWVLMDSATGRVILSENPEEKLPMASTTKIMSALITLEQENLDELFTVDSNAITVEGSAMGLVVGDKVSLRTLATGMMLPSGNDAARAAAVKISGSEQQFATLMNQYAQKIGMNNSSFTTASGLDVGEHYSTAYDMALLASTAIKNDEFASICSSKSIKVSFGNPPYKRTLYNHNKLVDSYENAIGVKTGFTKKAGRCLVSAAEKEGLTLICVTLNAVDDFNSHREIYEWAFENLKYVKVNDKISTASISVVGGIKDRIGIKVPWDFGAYLTDDEASHISIAINIAPFVYAPVKKGDPVGIAEISLGDVKIATAPIVAGEDSEALAKKYFWQNFFNKY